MKNTIKFTFAIIIGILSLSALSQSKPDTSYWTNSYQAGLNLNTASFSDNWTGGGINSVSFGGFFLGKANYKKDKNSWDNELDLQYGILKNKDQDARKSLDRILFDSKYGYDISKDWNLFASLNFQSQFDVGYRFNDDGTRDKISNFIAPAFITSSWGFEYKPVDYFWLRISPFSPRFTIVNDTSLYNAVPNNYGVEIGEKTRTEWFAFKIAALYEKEIVKNINLKAKYEMFANLEEFEGDKIDHRLDVNINAKVNDYISVGITTIAIYDFDQIDEWQTSFATAFNLIYKWGNQ